MHSKRNRIGLAVLIMMVAGLSGCATSTIDNATTSFRDNGHYDPKRAASINMQLGLGYLKQGNIERAKSKLLLALKQNDSNPSIQSAMGYFYETTGNIPLAKQFYLKSIALASDHGDLQNNYGTFLCRQGQYRQSIPYFVRAATNPDYLQVADAYENAGICALSIPNKAQATEFFNKAILNDPKRARSFLELATIAFENKQYTQAKRYLNRFNRITIANSRSLWLGIQVAEKIGEHNAAASYALMLKSKFGNSEEYQSYLNSQKG